MDRLFVGVTGDVFCRDHIPEGMVCYKINESKEEVPLHCCICLKEETDR